MLRRDDPCLVKDMDIGESNMFLPDVVVVDQDWTAWIDPLAAPQSDNPGVPSRFVRLMRVEGGFKVSLHGATTLGHKWTIGPTPNPEDRGGLKWFRVVEFDGEF